MVRRMHNQASSLGLGTTGLMGTSMIRVEPAAQAMADIALIYDGEAPASSRTNDLMRISLLSRKWKAMSWEAKQN
uniref:Bm11853 n=1 Tax=Brugia malayi TaxID=6279 RepID=A0A1I9GAC6_BRUMA|nr:Bm11853 [Brugia malayi]